MQSDRFEIGGNASGEAIGQFHARIQAMREHMEKPILGCMCATEECNRPPIHSHLLSESWLASIAEHGHVLQFDVAVENAGKRPVGVMAKKIGINQATTFLGFCQQHDTKIFSCMENEPFTARPDQLAHLAYRSVCQEVCIKHQLIKCHLPNAFSPNSPDLMAMKVTEQFQIYLRLLKHKCLIEEAMLNDGRGLESFIVEFERSPTFLVATSFVPHVTFSGRDLDRRWDWTTMTIFPSAKGGFAVFTWHKSTPKNPSLLIKSLRGIRPHLVTSCLLNLAMEVSENVVVSPTWWNSLPEPTKEHLVARFGRVLFRENAPPSTTIQAGTNPLLDWKPIRSELCSC